MTQETAVHRWDAANAVGIPYEIPAAVAADGIDEFLMWFAARRGHRRRRPSRRHASICTAPTRVGDDRRMAGDTRSTQSGIEFTREHTKGDVAVRGRANDLLLWLWRRDAGAVDVVGDAAVAERFRAFPTL